MSNTLVSVDCVAFYDTFVLQKCNFLGLGRVCEFQEMVDVASRAGKRLLCHALLLFPCDETVLFELGINFDLCCQCLIKFCWISWSHMSRISGEGMVRIEADMFCWFSLLSKVENLCMSWTFNRWTSQLKQNLKYIASEIL